MYFIPHLKKPEHFLMSLSEEMAAILKTEVNL